MKAPPRTPHFAPVRLYFRRKQKKPQKKGKKEKKPQKRYTGIGVMGAARSGMPTRGVPPAGSEDLEGRLKHAEEIHAAAPLEGQDAALLSPSAGAKNAFSHR